MPIDFSIESQDELPKLRAGFQSAQQTCSFKSPTRALVGARPRLAGLKSKVALVVIRCEQMLADWVKRSEFSPTRLPCGRISSLARAANIFGQEST